MQGYAELVAGDGIVVGSGTGLSVVGGDVSCAAGDGVAVGSARNIANSR